MNFVLIWVKFCLPNDAEFKWGTYPQQWLGHADFKTIDDQAGADVSDNGGNVKVKNGGWYTLYIKGKINGEAIDYTLAFFLCIANSKSLMKTDICRFYLRPHILLQQ